MDATELVMTGGGVICIQIGIFVMSIKNHDRGSHDALEKFLPNEGVSSLQLTILSVRRTPLEVTE